MHIWTNKIMKQNIFLILSNRYLNNYENVSSRFISLNNFDGYYI